MQSISQSHRRCRINEFNAAAIKANGATGAGTPFASADSQWRRVRSGYSGIWNANPWTITRDRFCAALRSQYPSEYAQQRAALNVWESEGGAIDVVAPLATGQV